MYSHPVRLPGKSLKYRETSNFRELQNRQLHFFIRPVIYLKEEEIHGKKEKHRYHR